MNTAPKNILCIDLGGTKLQLGKVNRKQVSDVVEYPVPAHLDKEDFSRFLIAAIAAQMDSSIGGISIGIPGLVNVRTGYVIEVINISKWCNVPLQTILEQEFSLPVVVHNDANCFSMGEYVFANEQQVDNFVGVCLGTGLGAGLIMNGSLYTGKNSASGEFGSFLYKDGITEQYCSGQFFKQFHQTTGKEAYQAAMNGCKDALALFEEMGEHLAMALHQIILAVDPEHVVIGGSVGKSFDLFSSTMMRKLQQEVNPRLFSSITISQSQLEYPALKGAFALFNQNNN
ncbi:ROK family protein [Psychrobium sp. 1_MG-2023]|uniref:ROK family protein n=1 Tax=Psychrobium sp. 1_MG-2023 TaxID=3062624 RepID=UPI000C348211|nr:ROK family protein [Psychrobium sp. 1_MG-2023]MDP2560040.1 ROK family protein [Psychrobium sp. 1_MG-2023]PKF56298.1 ROK family protein [Alteromonadales bacterium alter-6D02]